MQWRRGRIGWKVAGVAKLGPKSPVSASIIGNQSNTFGCRFSCQFMHRTNRKETNRNSRAGGQCTRPMPYWPLCCELQRRSAASLQRSHLEKMPWVTIILPLTMTELLKQGAEAVCGRSCVLCWAWWIYANACCEPCCMPFIDSQCEQFSIFIAIILMDQD